MEICHGCAFSSMFCLITCMDMEQKANEWHTVHLQDGLTIRETVEVGSVHPGFLEYFAYLHLQLIKNVTPIVGVGNPH